MKKGDLVAYVPKDANGNIYKCEIGKIKRIEDDGVFVHFHSGDTANKTNINDLIPIDNSVYIVPTLLGTGGIADVLYAGYYEDNKEYTVEVKKQLIEIIFKKMFNADNIKIV